MKIEVKRVQVAIVFVFYETHERPKTTILIQTETILYRTHRYSDLLKYVHQYFRVLTLPILKKNRHNSFYFETETPLLMRMPP